MYFHNFPVCPFVPRRISTVLKTTGTTWSPEQIRTLIVESATWISSSSIKRWRETFWYSSCNTWCILDIVLHVCIRVRVQNLSWTAVKSALSWCSWSVWDHVETGPVLCDWQRDGTLSAGRSAYINYCGILQQCVQAYISKTQVKEKLTLIPSLNHILKYIPSLSLFLNPPPFLCLLSSEFCSVERGVVWGGSDSPRALCYAEWPLPFSSGPGVSSMLTPSRFIAHIPDCSTYN